MIPKKDICEFFEYFRPISLCNAIYKIIAKRIKPIISRTISSEQYGFLDGKQILKAIKIAPKDLDYIKVKNKSSFIINLGLDGTSIDYFIGFIELNSNYLLLVVEESKN